MFAHPPACQLAGTRTNRLDMKYLSIVPLYSSTSPKNLTVDAHLVASKDAGIFILFMYPNTLNVHAHVAVAVVFFFKVVQFSRISLKIDA